MSTDSLSRATAICERWLGELGQVDKWNFCLSAARMPRIGRGYHVKTTPPDAQPGIQGQGGIGGHQGGEDICVSARVRSRFPGGC